MTDSTPYSPITKAKAEQILGYGKPHRYMNVSRDVIPRALSTVIAQAEQIAKNDLSIEGLKTFVEVNQSLIDSTVETAGLSHMVQEDGDGDWATIWDLIWQKLEAHETQAEQIKRLQAGMRTTGDPMTITSTMILDALRRKYPGAAIVPEITIDDFDLPDSGDEIVDGYHRPTPPPEGHKYSRRIDALMFESLVRTAIEIKVSKADFNRDTYWKRRMWQKHCHRFIYVVPEGLDVMSPHGCGLWTVSDTGEITVVKKAIFNKVPESLPQAVVQRLAYRAAGMRKP